MKWLITGADGQLGQCLIKRLTANANNIVIAKSRQSLDIVDLQAITTCVNIERPDIIVNAAAYTAVDQAETESAKAYLVNSQGPENLAIAANSINIPLIHISTDYVFNGESERPYLESDTTSPQSVYGLSKLAGEHAIQKHTKQFVIIRTAWVFSEHGNNFVKTMVRLAQNRDSLSVVADQFGGPTYAGDLANAIITIAQRGITPSNSDTYHYASGPAVSWFSFAESIFQQAVASGLLNRAPILAAITTEQYPTPASRPKYSVLDGSKLKKSFGVVQGDWCKNLPVVLSTLKENALNP